MHVWYLCRVQTLGIPVQMTDQKFAFNFKHLPVQIKMLEIQVLQNSTEHS